MRRGDIVTVAAPGDFGKPRPGVVIQGDALNAAKPGNSHYPRTHDKPVTGRAAASTYNRTR